VDRVAGVRAHGHGRVGGAHEGGCLGKPAVAVLAAVREALDEEPAVARHEVVGAVADAGVEHLVGDALWRAARCAAVPERAVRVDAEPARGASGELRHAAHQRHGALGGLGPGQERAVGKQREPGVAAHAHLAHAGAQALRRAAPGPAPGDVALECHVALVVRG
jgi:hypothetical protein